MKPITCKNTGEEFTDYQDYLKSDHWQQFKETYYEAFPERKGKCMRCKKKRKQIHFHHLNYKALGDERFDDVELLCKDCHEEEHNIKQEEPKEKENITGREVERLVDWMLTRSTCADNFTDCFLCVFAAERLEERYRNWGGPGTR